MKTTRRKSRRTQITFDPEIHRRARRRTSDLGISLAEYLRSLVARDLGHSPTKADPVRVFDFGRSEASDVSKYKAAMAAEALAATRASYRQP